MSGELGRITRPASDGAPDRGALLCVLGLALVPFLLFWRVTLGHRVFADGDLFTYNYPILHVVAEQWRDGRVPLWNPYIFGGTPLLAAIQGGVFYPPNVLLLLKPLWLWFGYSILLHYSLCGVFSFLYLRRLDLSRAAALLGSLVYTFGAFTMAHLGHVGMLRTVPWLPLVLWGFEAWRRHGSARHLALGALAVALMLVAGHPQVPFYALVVASTYALWFAVGGAPGERRRALVGFLLMVAAGAAAAGVQLLPTASALRDDYVRDGGGTYEYFTMYSFPPAHLISFLFPRLMRMDLGEMSGYVGIAPLVLAFVGGFAARGPHDRHRRYYFALAVVSVLLVFGSYNPLYPLLYHLPLYNSFRIPSRNWFEFTLAAAVLAGLGLDSLRNDLERARRGLRWALAGVGLTAIGTAAVAAVARGGLGGPAVQTRLPFLGGTLLLLGWVAARPRASRYPGVAVALAVLVAADLFSLGGSLYRQYDPTVYTRTPEALQFLRRQDRPFRILTLGAHKLIDPFRESLAPDSNAPAGVESLGGYDVLVLRHIAPASAGVAGPSGVILRGPQLRWRRFRWFMDLLGTRFMVVSKAERDWKPDPERYRVVHENDSVVVYENQHTLPRFFWVPQVRQADRWSSLVALKSGRVGDDVFDPRRSALVEVPSGVPAPDPRLEASPGPGADLGHRVEILDVQPGEARVRLESHVDGLLVHGSNMASGWTATVDGAAVPVYRTDGFLQGVVVPAGSHLVEFRYDPVSFKIGAATSLVGLGLVGAVLAWPVLLRRAGAVLPGPAGADARTDEAPG